MATYVSPAPVVNDDTKGPLINVALWVVLTASALATGLKLFIKIHATKTIGIDDLTLVAAFAIVIGQTVAISIEVNNGLGSRNSSSSPDQVVAFLKAQYATHILYALGIFIIKLTPLYFFPAISPSDAFKFFIRITTVFAWIWAVISLLVTAFQCHLPQPWKRESGQCIDQAVFWAVFLVIDIITQLIISLLPILLLRHVQMTQRWKRLFSMLCFTPNIITIPVAIIRYIYFLQLRNSTDYQFDAFNYILVTGIQPHLALIFVAISFIKPFVDSLIAIPQVIGDSPNRYPTHPTVYPASNFNSSVVSGSRKSRRGTKHMSNNPLQSVLRWSGFARTENESTMAMSSVGPPAGPYVHLNDIGRSNSEATSEEETPRQVRLAGRPLVIMKTMTASVSTEPR